jgi:DNA invertase Pin-like site-specific DNA recombinase
MLDRLAPGDVATVTRIDRLARSIFDLFGIVKRIAHAKAHGSAHWASRGPTPGPVPAA